MKTIRSPSASFDIDQHLLCRDDVRIEQVDAQVLLHFLEPYKVIAVLNSLHVLDAVFIGAVMAVIKPLFLILVLDLAEGLRLLHVPLGLILYPESGFFIFRTNSRLYRLS